MLPSTTEKQPNTTMLASTKRQRIMRKQRAATNGRLECIQAKLQKPMQTNTERNSAERLERRASALPAPFSFLPFYWRVALNVDLFDHGHRAGGGTLTICS